MDPKELRNSSLAVNVNDDTSKYAHNSSTLPEGKNKSYNDIGTSSIGKVDASTIRPCAIIGPDRVLPHATGDFHLKKSSVEPWTYPENVYRQLPDYPTKPNDYHPTRNISPRQTFQENMQRIMVSPIYSSVKNSDDSNIKNSKLNMPQEAKYCDVPYNINTVNNDHKSVRNSDIPMSSVNPSFSRSGPPYSWPAPVNIRPSKPYGASEYYQYSEYANCGPRPMMTRPLRSHHEETTQAYSERLYQDANIRFKPYPPPKDKHQHMRYDYINNYQNTFHPPVPIPPHKFDLQKPLHGHPYPIYPQLKYLERRIHDPFTDGYQRPNQNNLNTPFRNQILPPPYGPLSGNCVQNKPFTDMASKPMTVNKHLTFDSNNKIYLDLEPTRKAYPTPENIYYNDMNHIRGEMVIPNHSTLNMHTMPQHQMYRRDNPHIKPYEYNIHYRNVDQSMNLNYSLQRLPLQFSPNAIAISPSDSNTSIDTIHTMNMSQEDCGYVSQSSTTSVRSLDSGHVPLPNEFYRRRENYGNLKKSSHGNDHISQNQKNKINTSNKKNLDVRQFLQMWNEGEDETNEPTKDVSQIQVNNLPVPSEQVNNQEQLYVLGLVNVPSEELSKYDHIQKISKLPENIKGYNSIEILNQYEKFVESSNTNNHFTHKHIAPKEHHFMSKRFDKENSKLPRPVSPLDVEAKISQSVIHKEVGCNFEIKPCSPEMLNVEIATPVQNILGERIIEKVTNSTVCKSPMLSTSNGNKTQNFINNRTKNANCNMINNQYSLNNFQNSSKPNNYNAQDFNTSTGISLASLPRLDNDIELNFPEINQQFMTANKIETEIVVPAKDLPRLDIEDVNSINDNNVYQQNILSSPVTFCQNIEKETTKLSKYRKNKKCDVITKEENFNENKELIDPVHQRIDSVIIKNPDNIKIHENLNEMSVLNVVEENNRQCEIDDKSRDQTKIENDVYNLSFETAIDFSLNKSDQVNDTPCHQIIDTIEKSKKIESTCIESLVDKDNIKNKTDALDDKETETVFNVIGKQSPHRESMQCPFEVNEYLQIKPFEESNVPVIKELSSESESAEAINTNGKENDASVIQENKVTPLKSNRKDFRQEEIITEKEIDNKNDLLSSETCVSNKSEISHSNGVENLKLDINTISEKKIETDEQITVNSLLCNISLQEEHFSNNNINLTSSNDMENNILEGAHLSYVKVENDINSKESTITNKFTFDVNESNETEKDILLGESFKLNQKEKPRNDENIIYKLKSDIEIIDKKIEIEDINSQHSNTKFNDKQINLDIVPNNNIEITDRISCKEEEDILQIQSAIVDVENESNLKNNENIANVSSNTVGDTLQNDKYMLITQDFLAKEISNEEILNNTNSTSDGIKGNKIEIRQIKEEINYDRDDSDINVSCSQHSKENPESLDATCCNVESSASLILSVLTNKITPTVHIYKELYSPWMQKLHLFNEGYCNSVPFIPKEVPKEGNLRSAIIIENDVEYVSGQSSVDSNILPPCDDNISEEQELITISSTEFKNDPMTVDLPDHLENFEKDNSINLLNNNCPTVFRRNTLKRCLSDSALYDYKDEEELKSKPNKRKKVIDNFIEPHIISEDICNIIQNNRRNSVSTFYNDSLYIVIDNDLIIEEDNEESDKIYISEMSEDLNITNGETIDRTDITITNELDSNKQIECMYSESIYSEEKTLEESWVEDVACIETVISEEVIEDSELNEESRKEFDNEIISCEPLLHCGSDNANKVKDIYGTTMPHLMSCNDVLETIRKTPQMDVNKTLLFNESRNIGEDRSPNQLNNDVERDCISTEIVPNVPSYESSEIMDEKENIAENVELNGVYDSRNIYSDTDENQKYGIFLDKECEGAKNYTTRTCHSPDENLLIDMKKGNSPSSPEVSSTTSEEKNSNILLKITNYNGSRMSQINEVTTGNLNKLSYKLTEKKEYRNYNSNFRSSRTLITKAAQKYIPPLKNTIRDLKVKLPLPEHRLNSLKQLKTSKIVPKIDDIVIKINEKNHKQSMPKKQKPKFEDVLKSIDEIQFKRRKNSVKKGKNIIPKVIIKKNENGAHYASTNTLINTEAYNPDLTGRKWQPWVFLEKNNFIDKMAIKNKSRAVYCHRKKTFVIAERFKKYKSIYNANFVISQPNSNSCNKGNLKYTIRLKHN